MNAQAPQPATTTTEPMRRLSIFRLFISLLVLAGIGVGAYFAFQTYQSNQIPNGSSKPWFASYVDVTATPTFAFEKIGATSQRDAILSFIVSKSDDACTPAWGSSYTLDKASSALDLDRRIARLQQQGGSVAVSFGGLLNNELAVKCTDATKLESAYQAVIDRYHITTIDLDIEGDALNNTAANERRATAIAHLQKARRDNGKPLAVWLTLPVTPQGMSEAGTATTSTLLNKGVDVAGVNVMTMDYGKSLSKGKDMLSGSESALMETKRQLGILYDRAGTHLNDNTLWRKIGATPMIGQNDTADEIFTLDNAKGLNNFALSHGLGRMSMWSANRDITCGSNYIDVTIVSSSCSGVIQGNTPFASLLGAGFVGNLNSNAQTVTKAESQSTKQITDDPSKSPYQIWSETGAYLEGTKVVWHHNVYQAKWWTQGDMPDSPVLQSWQTPWQLIGPVLPGEKPVSQATLPEGTYPNWSGDTSYNAGQRVLLNGTPYQAKWWNQGQSPAASTSAPDSSPWTALTQAQIDAIESNK